MDRLNKIRGRQQARFIKHLKNTKQHTAALEKDVVRSFGFFEQDVEMMIAESESARDVPELSRETADERAERKAQELVQRMAGRNRG